MKLEVGKTAPDFSLKDKDGKITNLKETITNHNHTIIYFYPKDNTPGCTIEANDFTKYQNDFNKLNTKIIGISGGDEKSKEKFCTAHNIKITLLSDPDFKTSTKYGVYGEKSFMGRKFMGIKRFTFILDKNKKIIKIYPNVKAKDHAEEVLEFIKSLKI